MYEHTGPKQHSTEAEKRVFGHSRSGDWKAHRPEVIFSGSRTRTKWAWMLSKHKLCTTTNVELYGVGVTLWNTNSLLRLWIISQYLKKKNNIFAPRRALSSVSAMQSMKSGKYCKSELIRK